MVSLIANALPSEGNKVTLWKCLPHHRPGWPSDFQHKLQLCKLNSCCHIVISCHTVPLFHLAAHTLCEFIL